MKLKKNYKNKYKTLFIILAVLIIIRVLFISPQVGVADQGDFDRVIGISRLSLLDSDLNNPNFNRFYNYIIPAYKITAINNIFMTLFGSSIGYLIVLITSLCKLFGETIFKTQYLAISYSIIYIGAFTLILKSLNIKNNRKFILLGLLILFIFFDGNYLIWFNSLYGEPMMIITLLLFIGSVLHYIHYKYIIKGTEKITSKIVFILIAALLFLGSKLQVLTSLPFILILVGKIIKDNKYAISKNNIIFLLILFFALIAYPVGININSGNLSHDTQYNSVFYGILNGSNTPEQDLIDLGLNPDMAVEAGKHSYLNENEYVKYIPRTELTNEEFYSKMSNSKLAKFYLTHPVRLISGMQYTASKAFYTSTDLGKYTESYSETPIKEFNRFTLWSYFRENKLPRNLWFIVSVYSIVFLVSLYKYIKNKSDYETKTKVMLLWTVMLIGGIQFPMPFVGNGQADTAKQLFLFNFVFDILLVIIVSYILSKIIDLLGVKSKK